MDSEIVGKNRREVRQMRRLEKRRQAKTRNARNVVNHDGVQDAVLRPGGDEWTKNVERIKNEQDSFMVEGQNFLVLQYVNERTNVRSKEPALKFKGVFATMKEADEFMAKCRPYDNNTLFDTIAVDMGTWMIMPPRPEQFRGTEIVYDHPELQRIMDMHLKHVVDDYNSVQKRLNFAQRQTKANEQLTKTDDNAVLQLTKTNDNSQLELAAAPAAEPKKEPAPLDNPADPKHDGTKGAANSGSDGNNDKGDTKQ